MFKVWNEDGDLLGRANGETALLNEGYAILDEVYEGEDFKGWIVEE